MYAGIRRCKDTLLIMNYECIMMNFFIHIAFLSILCNVKYVILEEDWKAIAFFIQHYALCIFLRSKQLQREGQRFFQLRSFNDII